ncbi:MAG TPA: hypothetical protein VFC84_00810 [Desulfosporosinus sp.]|nr:hypothetical protein [Desulfosporosinus sp.]
MIKGPIWQLQSHGLCPECRAARKAKMETVAAAPSVAMTVVPAYIYRGRLHTI